MNPVRALGRRWERAGLRDRVLVLVLSLLLASSAVVFATTTLALRHYLLSQLDQRVTLAGSTYQQSLGHPDPDGDSDRGFDTQGQAPGTLGARVTPQGALGGVVHDGTEPAALSSADAAAVGALSASGHLRTVDLPTLGEYRIATQLADDGDLLVTGLPTHWVDDTVRDLALVEAIVFGAVLLATALIGRRLVGRSLRPLADLTRTAREVSDLPLAEGDVALHARMPHPAGGTEIGEVADAFNHMLDHLARALTIRQRNEEQVRQFVADASHELRTPISVIRGHAEFARREDPDTCPTTSHALERINVESERMGGLVDNLLLLARLDTGQQHAVEDLDVTLLVIDAVDGARVRAADHRWHLDLPEEPVTMRGDEDALRRAVINLVSNAGGHTPAGTMVQVTVRAMADGHVEVVVGDDGPGIAPTVLPHVFDRFVRGDPGRSRGGGSSGLGLSIARTIARAHGGDVTATSVPGRTEFVLRLPAHDAAPT